MLTSKFTKNYSILGVTHILSFNLKFGVLPSQIQTER